VVESGDESNDRFTDGEITRNQESMMHDLDSYLEDNILKDNSWADSAEKSTKQGYSQLELIGDLVLQSPAQTHKANRQSEGYSRTRELI
jgi:hypothetical protein